MSINGETKEKDRTIAKKSSAGKKPSSASRESKEKDLTMAKKASAGKKSIVTCRAKFET